MTEPIWHEFDVSIRMKVYAEDREEAVMAVAELMPEGSDWYIQLCSPCRITHV
jgi:hypothetical protein